MKELEYILRESAIKSFQMNKWKISTNKWKMQFYGLDVLEFLNRIQGFVHLCKMLEQENN